MNYNDSISVIYVIFILIGIPTLLFILFIFGIKWAIRRLISEVCTCKTIIIDDKAF
ncbi:hypothetical protein [Clostridium tagluense]|uniref:Uncharacterized protein n=1 Tax=Clostridium tagluense TaxID=360422 RepID=A0A401UT95_9CLOT|nr:hypothetical protein [Clostridium tagluense]GCD12734.1 hypothetical protein Ctaglu_43570 [Clostridium tagluense]